MGYIHVTGEKTGFEECDSQYPIDELKIVFFWDVTPCSLVDV
jgi:hypothetical protein